MLEIQTSNNLTKTGLFVQIMSVQEHNVLSHNCHRNNKNYKYFSHCNSEKEYKSSNNQMSKAHFSPALSALIPKGLHSQQK